VACSTIARRPTGRRAGPLDRPACQHVLLDLEPTGASGSRPVAAGPAVSAAPARPADEGASIELTAVGFWQLLPEAERARLGLRFSRLVLKALRPLNSKEDCLS
jgi:hypothetical protein